jgi:hypothetical protein
MIPILAAANAIGTVSSVASSALAAWKSLSSPQSASGKPATESFASLLSAHGVTDSGPTQSATPASPAEKPAHASAHRLINRLA